MPVRFPCLLDTIDNGKDRIAGNDTPTVTSHINDEPQTSIMSIMSITSTTEASHSSLEESGYDQPTKFHEKSTDEIKDDTNDVSKNGHNGDAERPQITTEKEILNFSTKMFD
jgi:hypothetical protein